MKSRTVLLLAAFCLLFILCRLPFVLWSEFVYDEEEIKTGAIAWILLDGPKLPLLDHQPGDYEGGYLLFGMLAVPFLLIFRTGFLALKMLGLAETLVLVVFSILWARKLAGRAGAVAAGALWLGAVPYVVQFGFIPDGNFNETAMLSVVTFYLLHTILFENKRHVWRFALLGFFFGLGFWMQYGYLVTVLVSLFMIYLSEFGLFFTRRFIATVGGAAIGFGPWLLYNITHHFWGIERFADGLKKGTPESKTALIARRVVALFGEDLPCSFHLILDGPLTTKLLSYAYYFVFLFLLVAFLVLARKALFASIRSLVPPLQSPQTRARLPELVPVVYFFAYAAVYCLSEYGNSYPMWGTYEKESHTHIFVLLPAMLWIGAVAAGRLARWNVRVAAVPVAAMALMGLVGQSQMLDFGSSQIDRLRTDFRGHRGVIYMESGNIWGRHPVEADRLAAGLDLEERAFFYFGTGIRFGTDNNRLEDFPKALAQCARLNPDFEPYCLFGAGVGLSVHRNLKPADFEARLALASPGAHPFLLAGIAVGCIWYLDSDNIFVKQALLIDYKAIAPPGHEVMLPVLIRSHLNIPELHPKKQ